MEAGEEIQYLKDLRSDWWKSQATCITVAGIIDKFGGFADKQQVISFFEKPRTYQHEIDFIIEQEG